MNTIRILEPAGSIDTLALSMEASDRPRAGPGECVIEIRSAGVNPSDVKAMLGAMPDAVWPRTPGRDYAGVVLEGPARLIGAEVWGSGGELGMRRDGTHARYLTVASDTVRAKPDAISLLEAGALGVPFIAAYEGLRRAGMAQAGDVVLVLGGNGKVGQAAVQQAAWAGARVFAVERSDNHYIGHACAPVAMLDASHVDAADYVKAQTGGHGADIVFNTVGSPYFAMANRAMASGGRQIFISTIEHEVPFDIFTFYRGQHSYLGINTLALTALACAHIFDALTPGFRDGALRPFPLPPSSVYPLDNALAAYRAVLGGALERVVLQPGEDGS